MSASQSNASEDRPLGQIAYEAYCKSSGGKSLVSGAHLPGWEQLKAEIRAAWTSAATAVAFRDNETMATLRDIYDELAHDEHGRGPAKTDAKLIRSLADAAKIRLRAAGWKGVDDFTDFDALKRYILNSEYDATHPVLTPGARLVAEERQRQIEKEGWTAEHDDMHMDESLAVAGACYALIGDGSGLNADYHTRLSIQLWPWAVEWYKPARGRSVHSTIRNLTKAGALIAADIDRRLRAEKGKRAQQ